MRVTLWAVLGIVLLLLGVPLALAIPGGNAVVGAAVAFLLVAVVEWRFSD